MKLSWNRVFRNYCWIPAHQEGIAKKLSSFQDAQGPKNFLAEFA